MQPSSRFLFLPLSSSTTAMCLIAVSVLGLDDSFSKWQHLFCIKCTAWFLKVVSLFSFSDLQYNLTSDLLHKPSFPPRFYFHGNGSSNITNERVRARQGHLTCVAHVAYQRVIYSPTVYFGHITIWCTDWINSSDAKMFIFPPLNPFSFLQQKDVRDIFTPVQFVVSYSLRETNSRRASSTSFPPLKPILQRSAGHRNTITSQVSS